MILGAWGGFKKRVHGVLIGWTLSGLALLIGGVPSATWAWLIGGFAAMMISPLINASNQAILQAKVPPHMQGRVFASRRLIAWLVSPLSQAIAGPLADRVFEPLMQREPALPPWVGQGPGTGMGIQIGLAVLFAALVGAVGYLLPAVRGAESRMPDHDADEAAAEMDPESPLEAERAAKQAVS